MLAHETQGSFDLALGGMYAVRFTVAFNDVDYCLRWRRAGKAIVWTPHTMLMHRSKGDVILA